MAQKIAVHGVEQQTTETGPYGDEDPCEEFLVLDVNGESERVPITGVRAAAFDYRGGVPDTIDFDTVLVDGDEIHAEAWLDDGSLVELYREHGTWMMERFDDPVDPGFEEIWSRPGHEEEDVAQLVERGLSASKALDFWMVKMQGRTASEWSDSRGVSHQAVSQNVRSAVNILAIGSDFWETADGFEGNIEYEHEDVDEFVAVTNKYVVDEEAQVLRVLRRYWDGGEEIDRLEQEWELSDDGERVEYSGETVEQFCRSNHFGDPQVSIEAVCDRLDIPAPDW